MFGCGSGILVTDYQFRIVKEIMLESEVEGIEPLNEDLVVIGRGEKLKLLDLNKMYIVSE